MSDQDDKINIKEVMAGNTQAFGNIVERYQNTIFSLTLRMTNNAEDSKDLTQNIFIKAFSKLHKYNTDQKFFSWFYRLAINETINYKKSQNKLVPLSSDEIADDTSYSGTIRGKEEKKKIHVAIQKLPPRYRILVILKYYEGKSYDDISRLLEIPVSKVKARLFIARQKLKEMLIG